MRKTVLKSFTILCVLSLVLSVALASNIHPVEASGTIYIRATGEVEGTDKIQRDGDVYTFTDNIFDEIVVERDGIVVDGAGYTVQGNGSGTGISLSSRSNIMIRNMEIKEFSQGISLDGSSNSKISYNNVTDNSFGIEFSESSNSTICGNNVANNAVGIHVSLSSSNNTFHGNDVTNNGLGMYFSWSSSGNFIYHNSFKDNSIPVQIYYKNYSVNIWDSGYPSGGNYWMNTHYPYMLPDSDHDGIADIPFIIDENNTDNYPLMGIFSDFNTTSEHHVQTICNSTIASYQFNGTAISFSVSGEDGTMGFCRVCIPTALMDDTYTVLVNGTKVPQTLLPFSNSTHSYLYFTYTHSTQDIVIIPELPSILILPLLMALTLGVVVLLKKKRLYIRDG